MLYCTDVTTYPYNNTGLASNVSVETIKGLRCSIMELYHTKLDCAKPLASNYCLLDEVCGLTSLNDFIEYSYCHIEELFTSKLDCICPEALNYYLYRPVCGFTSLNDYITYSYNNVNNLAASKLDCSCPEASDYYLTSPVCGYTSLISFMEGIVNGYSPTVLVYCGTDTNPGTLPETSIGAVYLCRHVQSLNEPQSYWRMYLGCNGGYMDTGINILSCYNSGTICGVGLCGGTVCLRATNDYYIGTFSHVDITSSDTYNGIWSDVDRRTSGSRAVLTNIETAWYGYSRCLVDSRCWFFGECYRCNSLDYDTYIKGIINNGNSGGLCVGTFRPYNDNNVYRCIYTRSDDIGLIKFGDGVCVITNNCMVCNCDITIHKFGCNDSFDDGILCVSQDNGCTWHRYVLDCDVTNLCNGRANIDVCSVCSGGDICIYCNGSLIIGTDNGYACISDRGDAMIRTLCTTDDVEVCGNVTASNMYADSYGPLDSDSGEVEIWPGPGASFRLCVDGHIYFNGSRLI